MYQQKKLKLIISSLKEKDLIQFFQLYADYFMEDIRKNIKKISFNCYETTIEHLNISVNGYGKNLNEAYAAGISNFMDRIVEDQKYCSSIKECIKRYTTTNFNNSIKTQPDNHLQKKTNTYTKPIENSIKSKENLKSVKTIKEEIFQSLNHDNIQLRTAQSKALQLNKNSSYSILQNMGQQNGEKNSELEMVLGKIRDLEQQLNNANSQNANLRSKLKEIQRQSLTTISQPKQKPQQMKTLESQSYLKDISSKFNNTTHPNQIKQAPDKLRSYSLSNSVNSSAFNSRVPPKIKIPKLNLEILPNYHGKSNKSLNQSLLQSFQKKNKTIYNG